MRRKNKIPLFLGLFIVLILAVVGAYIGGAFNITGGREVWLPTEYTIVCANTRTAYYPANSDSQNIKWNIIDKKGEYFYCNEKTFGSNADFNEGCNFVMDWNTPWYGSFSSHKRCDLTVSGGIGTCNEIVVSKNTPYTIFKTNAMFVNPNLQEVKIRGYAKVYGLMFNTPSSKLRTDSCNLASALNSGQIALLKSHPRYAEIALYNRVSDSDYGLSWIGDYRPALTNQIVTKESKLWYVLSPGGRYAIEEDSNNRLVVTDKFVADDSIQCLPNVPNYCDKDGKFIIESGGSAICTPGRIISARPMPVGNNEVCSIRCKSDGTFENYDCKQIEICKDGEILNQNYECISRADLTDKEACESKGGRWTTTKDGSSYCNYNKGFGDLTLILLIFGAVFIIILLMVVIKVRMIKK